MTTKKEYIKRVLLFSGYALIFMFTLGTNFNNPHVSFDMLIIFICAFAMTKQFCFCETKPNFKDAKIALYFYAIGILIIATISIIVWLRQL